MAEQAQQPTIKVERGRHSGGVPFTRYRIANGLRVLLYDDGRIKVAAYGTRMEVSEVLNRDGDSHVFIKTKSTVDLGQLSE